MALSFDVSNLTFIHYKRFQGSADEMKFVAYVLQGGIVLETMILSADKSLSTKKKYKILEKLSRFSRSSRTCTLKIDFDTHP